MSRSHVLAAVALLLLGCADAFAPSSFLGSHAAPQLRGTRGGRAGGGGAAAVGVRMMAGDEKKSFFGNMFEKAMLNIVKVEEKEGARKKLQKCVFCDGTGTCACESCEGTGTDVSMGGKCFLCDGKGKAQCGICNGIGLVDKVRRGGTDTSGKWVGSDKVMDPLSPQYEPYILTLDGGEKYVWCQCGVSVKQPFCDGVSHRAYGIKPKPFTADGEKGAKTEAALCGCKYTNTAPYCDGTHVSLKAEFDAAQAKKDKKN